jgi:hypothetical protein
MRSAALIVALCGGCATSLAGGANGALQSDGAFTSEANLGGSAGFADSTAGFLLTARGSLGFDAKSGGAVGGIEWMRYGDGEFNTVATGYHIGLYGGGRVDRHGGSALISTEYGHHFILGRLGGNPYRLISLTVTPSLGLVLPLRNNDRPAAVQFGLGLGVRFDSLESWRFRL